MSDPRRILDRDDDRARDLDSNAALKRSMLRAARREAPPPAAQQELLAALGLGDSAVSATPPAARPKADRAREWWVRPPLFSAVLQGGDAIRRRFGAGALVSAAVHAAVLTLVILGATRAPGSRPDEPKVMVQLTAPAPAPAPPGLTPAPLGDPSPVHEKDALTAPPERGDRLSAREIEGIRAGDPSARASSRDEAVDRAGSSPRRPLAPDAQVKLDPAPVSNVSTGATSSSQLPSSEVLAFGEGMSRPRLIEGPEPLYPRAAREARVEGTLLARCVITTEGVLRDCQIIKSLPFLDQPVLEALAQRRYAPVMFQGRAVNVEYVIPLRFELP
jgi:protein TonB